MKKFLTKHNNHKILQQNIRRKQNSITKQRIRKKRDIKNNKRTRIGYLNANIT